MVFYDSVDICKNNLKRILIMQKLVSKVSIISWIEICWFKNDFFLTFVASTATLGGE